MFPNHHWPRFKAEKERENVDEGVVAEMVRQ
jgi:hypothetical protein